jgi:hypothetical protein
MLFHLEARRRSTGDLKSGRGILKMHLDVARRVHQQDRTIPLQARETDEAAGLEQSFDYMTHSWATMVDHLGLAKALGDDHFDPV